MSDPASYPDTYKDRIIDSALRLAVARPWNEVSLLDIAQAAGSNLVELRRSFSSKADIIAAFTRRIDDEVLTKAPPPEKGQSHRDALFEVLMSRFDVLKPHKEAIRSIIGGARFDPALLKSALASQTWMLQAAGINTDGTGGALRVTGLTSVYAATMRTWLNDDDPGLARTMAALDRRLRRGERSMEGFEEMSAFVRRVGGAFRKSSRRRDRTDADTGQHSPEPPPEAPPSPQPGTP